MESRNDYTCLLYTSSAGNNCLSAALYRDDNRLLRQADIHQLLTGIFKIVRQQDLADGGLSLIQGNHMLDRGEVHLCLLYTSVPLVMARIIDIGVKNGDGGYVLRMGGLLLLIAAVSLGCALICQYFASIASQGVGTNLRREMYRKINSFSHAELDRFGTHSLITRLTNDVNQLQLAVAMLIRLVVRAPFLAVGAVVMAFTIDVKLSLIFLVVFPLIVGVLYFVMSRSVPDVYKRQYLHCPGAGAESGAYRRGRTGFCTGRFDSGPRCV